jgi:hypothetical protein
MARKIFMKKISSAAASDHVCLGGSHSAGIQSFVQISFAEQFSLGGDLADGFSGFQTFLGDVGSLVVTDNGRQAGAHRQTLLDQTFTALLVGGEAGDTAVGENARGPT